MTLLASFGRRAAWLVDMSRSFRWDFWTPSVPLVHERSLWHAMIAARAAAAFGPDVLAAYIDVLRTAVHPLRIFDAAFRILAIGLGRPEAAERAAEALLARIESLNGSAAGTAITTLRCAATTLRAPDVATRAIRPLMVWGRDRGAGFASKRSLTADPGAFTSDGECLGMLAVPPAAGASVKEFFPDAATSRMRTPMWLGDVDLATLATNGQPAGRGLH